MSSTQQPAPYRVAIIGGGPRGLWALEELRKQWQASTAHLPVAVTLIEPHAPGAGWVYRAGQSPVMRLNAPASVVTSLTGGAFSDWLAAKPAIPGAQAGDPASRVFVPRVVVGEFLHHCYQQLLADLPPGMTIEHLPGLATDVAISGDTIDVSISDLPEESESDHARSFDLGNHRTKSDVDGNPAGAPVVPATVTVDEVLFATGHVHAWEGELSPALHPYFAPGVDVIPAGACVHMRGAALTAIDVCLLLTEGRGGRFATSTREQWRYVRCGQEPKQIIPYSRSGRFMEVKPAPGSPLYQLDVAAAADLSDLLKSASTTEAIIDVLQQAAIAWLQAAGETITSTHHAQVRAVLSGSDGSGDAVGDLRRSVQVIRGTAAPSPQWAVGDAFRRLYPALVTARSYHYLPGFHRLCRTLERVAFGPPETTAGRLLALIDEGIVTAPRTCALPNVKAALPETDWQHQYHRGDDEVWLVDATIAPPGIHDHSLAGRLRKLGLLTSDENGLLAIGRNGYLTGSQRLAMVGRDVEGTVLGHDTLSRAMHPEIPRWAATVHDHVLAASQHST
ncbi:FAD/NAD(P)-binding protein [Corynebacterium choanae]|uniref:FAD-dependent urate hydroxylase HpyO/Asp monooxygenase CreE-like FAD/NAD(P)-binding domain-containing protein n=1 Tax=Corynebacterium choanae TaxID=1862358 RepID=A0A3G6J855_9CORY|nr:FAD/NAD(P)-binding domain-containing protein [Corynebacterium choanae]AZA14166.1 hypothetical protein CCHOA_08910 [Corynebacterium choanae]